MKKKILTVQFRHETNVFSPAPADERAYRNTRFHVGEEVFPGQRGIGTELGAYLRVFEAREDVEMIPTVGLNASPSGIVTADVYNFVIKEVTAAIEKHAPFDAVLVDCHGAMVAEGHCDGEGDLYEHIRSMVGDSIPLMAALDLHANITSKMARCARQLRNRSCYRKTDGTGLGRNSSTNHGIQKNSVPSPLVPQRISGDAAPVPQGQRTGAAPRCYACSFCTRLLPRRY